MDTNSSYVPALTYTSMRRLVTLVTGRALMAACEDEERRVRDEITAKSSSLEDKESQTVQPAEVTWRCLDVRRLHLDRLEVPGPVFRDNDIRPEPANGLQ